MAVNVVDMDADSLTTLTSDNFQSQLADCHVRGLNPGYRAWGSRNSGTKDQEKETAVVWTRGTDGGEKTKNAVLHGLVEGKRSRGRQRKIWMDNVREDLKEKNSDLTRIGEVTRNREVWRSLVRASSSAC